MSPFLSRWIDRFAIHFAAARMPQPDGRDLHLDEAEQLLQHLDFRQNEVKSAVVEFDGPAKFRFASPRPTAFPANNIVHGRLYQCDERWQQKPTVLLLHGWNDVLNHSLFFPRDARRLNKMGINAATLQLPWHFDRRPRELGAWSNFLSADVLRTVEATEQAIAEIQAFVNWLVEQGCPFVGLWGISMGAWLAGLTICHDSRIGAVVLTVPVARLDRLIEEVEFCETIRHTLQGRQIDLRALNLVSNTPIIDKSDILLIEAEQDLFVAKDSVEDLWQAWNKPEIWRHQSGHISILCAGGLSNQVARWIAAKANEQAVK